MNYIIQPWSGEQVSTFHLQIRQWQEAKGLNNFKNILDSQKDLNNIQEFYIDNGGGFWVAKNNDIVIGIVGLSPLGEIKRFAVSPEQQGKGIGTELFDVLIQYGTKNFSRLYLKTGKQETALNIYLKAGFKIVGFKNNDYKLELKLS